MKDIPNQMWQTSSYIKMATRNHLTRVVRNAWKYVLITGLMLCTSFLTAGEYNTRLEATRHMTLGTLVSGVVQRVLVQPGQNVKQGELLLELDQREFNAEWKRAKAQANRANGLFEEALREEERAKELYDRSLLSDHDLQTALIERLQAESRKFDAAADLMQAKLNLERSRILAPVDGQIDRVSAWKGQPVQNSLRITPLLELLATDRLQFRVKLSQKPRTDRVRLQVGDNWYPVSSFTLNVTSGDEQAWVLEGQVSDPRLSPGVEAKVSVE